MKTVPSKIEYKETCVVKKYNFSNIYKKNFDNEIKILKNINSEYFIKTWNYTENGYSMERADFSLGTGRGVNESYIRRLFFSLSIDDIMKMLDNILIDLKKHKIEHRDLNPGNIVFFETDKKLKLIDFFWCVSKWDSPGIPDYANPVYTQNDDLAIEKIKKDILSVYNLVEKEMLNALNYFKNNVGKGEYQDGSSSSLGRAYHIVDLPYFKEKIEYSKDTCIGEYKLIKETIPIKPKSFIDIGCANGYFTFNLLRDFNIKKCLSFERDLAPYNFLNMVKNIYKLYEQAVLKEISNSTQIKGFDLAIFLNSHMWIYKQYGKKITFDIVKNMIKKSKIMYFQTAGGYSKGRYTISEYKHRNDIVQMLSDAGAQNIDYIDTTIGAHNAPRDMFLVQ